jgi:ribonuclease P protein component
MQEGGKKRFTLPARARVKQRRAFDQLFLTGQSVRQHPLRLTWILTDTLTEKREYLRAGFSVPKRKFKHAVDRNLLKRRMREAYRLQALPLRDFCEEKNLYLDILFVYQHHAPVTYQEIASATGLLLKKLQGRLVT